VEISIEVESEVSAGKPGTNSAHGDLLFMGTLLEAISKIGFLPAFGGLVQYRGEAESYTGGPPETDRDLKRGVNPARKRREAKRHF